MLTCAGRRNYLVRFFQEALRGRGQVFAADACADAPALRQADKSLILPPLNQTAYIDTLLSLCQRHSVLLLIPLNDLELPLLARHSARFREVGTIPVISSPEVASIGIEYSDDDEELKLDYTLAKKRLPRTLLREINGTDPERCILVQERLCGQEFGLDVVNDLEGHYVCTFVKRKLAMRAGETDRAITVKSDLLEGIGGVIGRKLGHIGVLDCDVIVTKDSCYVLDMNPRFGGGYPFSHIAGANLPAVLIAWANREQPDAHWLRVEPNIMASKCDGLVVVDNGLR